MKQSYQPPASYTSDQPYPEVCVERPNASYGRAMLDNLGGFVSEMSAVSLYFYNSLISAGKDDLSTIFHKISVVEMHHMEIFGKLALKLGENPRLWSVGHDSMGMVYWSPSFNQYPRDLQGLLLNSIRSEQTAVSKYTAQCEQIQDVHIRENLRHIIEDEKVHIQIFTGLFQKYFKCKPE